MPVRFKNISSSGQAKFMNVSGLGQARFYIPPPEYLTVSIYAKQEGVTQDVDLHFSTDGGSTWDFAGLTFNSSTCISIYTDTAILQGSSFAFRFGSPTNINTVYRHNATFTTEETCPAFVDYGGGANAAICERAVPTQTSNITRRYNCTIRPEDSTGCPDPATTTTTTTTTTTAAPFYIKGTDCATGTDIRFFSYTDGPLNDGDVIQINSGINMGCWTLSTTKPGAGENGSITGLWSPLANCGACSI